MSSPRQREYLESKINTASAPKLHLMLIDGALRFGREAEKALMRDDADAASEPLLRAIRILGEMIVGVRDGESEVNQKLLQVYQFIYHRMTTVYVSGDLQHIAEVLKILEFEQETWRQACEKVASEQEANQPPKTKPVAPHIADASLTGAEGSLRLEA